MAIDNGSKAYIEMKEALVKLEEFLVKLEKAYVKTEGAQAHDDHNSLCVPASSGMIEDQARDSNKSIFGPQKRCKACPALDYFTYQCPNTCQNCYAAAHDTNIVKNRSSVNIICKP